MNVKKLKLTNNEESIQYRNIKPSNKETATICKSVNSLRSNMINIIVELKWVSGKVMDGSSKLSEVLNENVASIEEVTRTLAEIVKAIESEANESQHGIEQLSSLSEEINVAAQDTNILAEFTF